MTRTKHSNGIRGNLINQIRAINCHLGNSSKVWGLSYFELLCNIHPLYRATEAKKLNEKGLITKQEYIRFII